MLNTIQLVEIINDLRTAIEEASLIGVNNNQIFVEATSYQRGFLAGESRRIKDVPVTEAQLKLMKNLKMNVPNNLTQKQAGELIKAKLEKDVKAYTQ